MKHLIGAVFGLTAVTSATAWQYTTPDYGFYSDKSTSITTFGSPNWQQSYGTLNGMSLNIQSFGGDNFRQTYGTIGNRSFTCTEFGGSTFRQTICN